MEDEISPVSLRKRNVTRKAEGTNKTCNEGDPRENGDRSSNISESLKGHVSGKDSDSVAEADVPFTKLNRCLNGAMSVVKFPFALLRPLFDINENKNNPRGFYRIKPEKARKIHNLIVEDDSGSDSDAESVNLTEPNEEKSAKTQPSSSKTSVSSQKSKKLKMSVAEMLTIGQQNQLEVEKIALVFCALIIVFGYPWVMYLNLRLF